MMPARKLDTTDVHPNARSVENAVPSHVAEVIDGPAYIASATGNVVFANTIAQAHRGTNRSLQSGRFRWFPLLVGRVRFFLVVPAAEPVRSHPWAERWKLPPRQVRVAHLIAHGFSDKEIAIRTGLTLSTTRTYVKQLFASAGVHSRTEIIRAMLDFPRSLSNA